ncbi:aldehyde dehydrogenase family protein [Albidovulum inexpectatum]|nr:aldehyde dehydrogenase family protein [Albidovulum inexpectatum]
MDDLSTPPDSVRLQGLFDAMRTAARARPVVDLATRLDRLTRLRAMVLTHEQALVDAIGRDFGHRPAADTRILDIAPLLNAIHHARRRLKSWMRPRRRPVSWLFQPARAWIEPRPLGVVGVVAPWNYPLYLALGPAVDALAAGNRVLIKPSELCPAFSDLLARIVADSFAPDELAVVTGGPDLAARFCALPFDHLVFTGSTAVGRKVAQAAAPNLTPVTLELGGKSPAILAPDADPARAARSILFGKIINAGQTCVAPDYVLAPRDMLPALTDALHGRARDILGDGPCPTAIISDRHHARLMGLLDDLPPGTRVQTIGRDDPATRRMALRLVIDPAPDSALMREEIFGPILPVLPVDDIAQALDFVAGRDRPLAAYVFARSSRAARAHLAPLVAGGVTIGGTILHLAQDELPFGGVGASGMGAYHGSAGFERFSHMMPVFDPGPVNAFERMGPRFGRMAMAAYRLLRMR